MAAFWWGTLAATSLVLGGLVGLLARLPRRALGLITAAGVGVLTSAVAYELVEESFETSAGSSGVAWGMLAGALAFYAGDAAIDRFGGHNRKRSSDPPPNASPLAIVLGTVLDGIPESIVLGLSLIDGTITVAVLAAIFLSNLPEALTATVGLRAQRWRPAPILAMWTVTALVSGLSALLGYTLLDTASPGTVAFVNAFAGGAVLTMLADTMAPEAYANGGRTAGLATTIGFLGAFLLSAIT